MKGLVLVAGKGTRLRPLTHTGPKHLIPLAGKPMMQYAIEHLVEAGIRDIGIVVGYMRDQIIEKFGDGSQFGAHFEYIVQEPQIGIAHAIKVSQEYIEDELMFLRNYSLENAVLSEKSIPLSVPP